MATNNMIPYSNPAGNNQTTPKTGITPPGTRPMAVPGSTSAGVNPLMPAGTGGVPSVPNVGGLTTTGANIAGDTGGLKKQLVDIYGKGVGGSLESLLAGMSGTDSKILQEYIASLQPQMATAQANTNAALGAGGVSANSSVAAIADSNLQSQETAAIAGESAKLTLSQEQLTAQLLQGMQGSAAKQVGTSAWTVLADVLGAASQDVGAIIHGGAAFTPGSTPAAPNPNNIGTQGLSSGAVPGSTGANDLTGTVPTNPADAGFVTGDSVPAFA